MGCPVNAPDNAMVVGLAPALERHYAAADSTAHRFAELRVLGDVLEFSESIEFRDGLSNEADRVLRIYHRLFEADSCTVLAALLLAAHRNDAEDTLRAARLLVTRYLARQADRIARIAGGDE